MLLVPIAIASCLSALLIAGARICRAYLYSGGHVRARHRTAREEEDLPTAILALGGCPLRELEAAHLAQHSLPSAHLYVSSGELPDAHEAFAALAGDRRVTVDRTAVDTLSNFTSLRGRLAARGVRAVAVVTSKHHMPRAAAVARVVLGDARMGVTLHVAAGSNYPAAPEHCRRVVRDVLRAWMWILTGWDGRGIALYVHPYRDADRIHDVEIGSMGGAE